MNDWYVLALAVAASVGTGIMAGMFFTFSVFVMRALDRLPPAHGIAAMQSINEAIITPLFVLTFAGTAVVCLALAALAVVALEGAGQALVFAGALLYLAGGIALTRGYHIPRNDRLMALDPTDPGAERWWATYVREWTAWNHVRTLASVLAMVSFVLAIRVG